MCVNKSKAALIAFPADVYIVISPQFKHRHPPNIKYPMSALLLEDPLETVPVFVLLGFFIPHPV
jgi:hypothetical protein